jgi:hypothetical protein
LDFFFASQNIDLPFFFFLEGPVAVIFEKKNRRDAPTDFGW